ncbi:hypothetical protein SOASR030_13530 [Leminorella grimontii]|uniref:Inovirus Gp2 family protein n=1 Tax=Leminorella grimontii TaxID=82981 RepID=A0AAV5MZF8_9GAMM|nr:hypothetical protein [Leminorella grimontii]KFC97400.1 hypothetical protein GLGR_0334 [Leminorella grimontii ATCC 33999 = DSM 5078]GKX55241.1 hypothetical protein SOASR030_13530 [Leminorella grimontii]VFS56726.1 Uncharacterised protein [Leminorella grimontii]
MRKNGMNDFFEVNFMKLREKDNSYPSAEIRYKDLSNIYSFITFNNIKKTKETSLNENSSNYPSIGYDIQGKAHNLLIDVLESEKNKIPRHKTNRITDSDEGITLGSKVDTEYRKSLKDSLDHKESMFNKLLEKYSDIKKEVKGRITLIPVSFYINEDTNGELEYIIDNLTVINQAFNLMINKIKHRIMYKRIAGYTRISMIDETFTPYVHVLFFIQDGVINNDFIKKIVLEWCSFIPANRNCRVGIYSFDFNFLLSLYSELTDRQGNTYIAKNHAGRGIEKTADLFVNDILNPFPNTKGQFYDSREPFSLPASLIRAKRRSEEQNETEESSAKTKNQSIYNKIKNTPTEHKEYLLRIAKKINKIPFMHTIS